MVNYKNTKGCAIYFTHIIGDGTVKIKISNPTRGRLRSVDERERIKIPSIISIEIEQR